MKNSLLRTVMAVLAACCCMSCIYDRYPDEEADVNQITLALNMRLLGYGPTRAGGGVPPAERINSLRVVLVDLGESGNGVKETDPYVEYNSVLWNITPGSSDNGKEDVVQLQFPKIHAGRKKKIYFMINCEQKYLDLRVHEEGEQDPMPINLNNSDIYLPQAGKNPAIEKACFVSPLGSVTLNNLDGEDLLVPMTSFHEFSIPSIEELKEKYPNPLHTNIVYAVPNELYVVRAINKITFEFVNDTWDDEADGDGDGDGIDLLVKDWSISRINKGESYLFGKPKEDDELFKGYSSSENGNLNRPWMQWLRDEAERSQNPPYEQEWLKNYTMPSDIDYVDYKFSPDYICPEGYIYPEGEEKVKKGYLLPAPYKDKEDNKVYKTVLRTENDPVYFAESLYAVEGVPQAYELAFTVVQKEDGEWLNEYTYRAKSSVPDNTDGTQNFVLESLFRSTYVKVTVTFRSGLGHPDFEIDVHPYGAYELEPEFGL